MIDIHAHILPGIDDGAEDLDSALEMAALAAKSGVSILAVTPHCVEYAQQKNLWDRDLQQQIRQFREAVEQAGIPLQIVPGMEIFGTQRVPELLREGKMIGLNGSRYPLIEFSFYHFGAQATDILEEILDLGMRPVVAHPERYDYVQRDPAILNLWVQMGCLQPMKNFRREPVVPDGMSHPGEPGQSDGPVRPSGPGSGLGAGGPGLCLCGGQ